MKILIIGSGRVGARLAQRLERGGHEVTIIDENQDAFRRLGGDFRGTTIHGSGLDSLMLRRAGVASADVVVAATGGDNRNLMIVQMAKVQFGRARVVARLKDPIRAAKYRELGIETLCVTTVVEGLLELWVQDGAFPELPGEAALSGDATAIL